MANPIATENLLTGTTAWQITKKATTQIAGYCDKSSYNVGDTVTLFISTQVASTTYTINIYRLGWYGGTGACLKQQATGQVGIAQGYWDGTTLNNCPTAIIDNTTHNLEAGWASSYTWAIPGNAVSGVYLVQLTDANGFQNYASFVVKGNSSADYVVVRPVNTDCAYNNWGGYSLYTNPTVGVKVSFNRPDANGQGTGGLLQFEICPIKWLERQGYNLSYLTDVDVHSNAAQLLTYKAMISLGHHEYWSKEMRDGVEAMIAGGVGLAVLGANCCYWQVRYASDNAGNANRCLVCYKVQTNSSNLALDPFYTLDNTRVTSQWRDAVINRDEAAMLGIHYSSFLSGANIAWRVDSASTSIYLSGTGLVLGQNYGVDLVGFEFDKIVAASPSNIQVIATTNLTDYQSLSDHQNTTTYVATSGALVFAAGSFGWSQALDTYRWTTPATGPLVVPQIQALLANIMAEIVRNKTTKVFNVFAIRR